MSSRSGRRGADDVLLITARDKRAIEDHFDRSADWRTASSEWREGLLASIQLLMQKVRVHAVRQLQQRDWACGESRRRHVATSLSSAAGRYDLQWRSTPARQLADAHAKLGTAIIGWRNRIEKVERYGIVGGQTIGEGLLKLDMLVEKPTRDGPPADTPSRRAICSRRHLRLSGSHGERQSGKFSLPMR